MPSTMSNKQQLLMQSLTTFFEDNKSMFNQFFNIVKPDSQISLRVIDWFITNYSRTNDIAYEHPKTRMPFTVHDSYKAQLKAYSKRQFDPFCRRMRINFYYAPDQKITTTVGQLNFFRWAIENGVVEYILRHFAVIDRDMKNYVRHARETKRLNRSSDSLSVAPVARNHHVAGSNNNSASKDVASKKDGKRKKKEDGGAALPESSADGAASGDASPALFQDAKPSAGLQFTKHRSQRTVYFH